MYGQITIEYLIVTLTVLALLSISIFALLIIKKEAALVYSILQFKSDMLAIHNAAADVCALGDGNSRIVKLTGSLSISSPSSGVIELDNGVISALKSTECNLYSPVYDLKGVVVVKNIDGEISIEKE